MENKKAVDRGSVSIACTYKRKVYTDQGLVEQTFVFKSPHFEQITDTSNWKPTAEVKRDRIATNSAGNELGLYDSDRFSGTEDDRPSDIELALRSGVLDKADVQSLQEKVKADADKTVQAKRDKDALDVEAAKAKSRQAKLDEVLGVEEKAPV